MFGAMKFWSVLAILVLNLSEIRAGVLAQFKMSPKLGTMDIELYDLDKPVTVSNFIAYVKAGAWHDTVMNRWTTDFFLQGGYYNLPHDPTLMTPWNMTNQPQAVSLFPPIPSEMNVGRSLSNLFGTIGMGHDATNVNSATAGWYFNLKDNPSLDTSDGGYTVFGRVVRGTNILHRFTAAAADTNLFLLQGTSIPVWVESSSDISLLNVDITLLTAEIRLVEGGNEISWNSVDGVPNVVESTSTFPASWGAVATVTGTGARMSITNSPGRATLRHYRVRIDYGP